MVHHDFSIDIVDTGFAIQTTAQDKGTHPGSSQGCHFTCMTSAKGNVMKSWKNNFDPEENLIQLEVYFRVGSTCHDWQFNNIAAQEGEMITICDPDFILKLSDNL